DTRAVRDPDVEPAEAARATGGDVQAETVLGNRRAVVVERRIDKRAKVDRRRPGPPLGPVRPDVGGEASGSVGAYRLHIDTTRLREGAEQQDGEESDAGPHCTPPLAGSLKRCA